MNPDQQLQAKYNDLESRFNKLEALFYKVNQIDKSVFQNPIQVNGGIKMRDASILSLGNSTGGKVGDTGEKVGFLGKAPIARQSAISVPSGGVTIDSQARTAITTIINVLNNFGFTA